MTDTPKTTTARTTLPGSTTTAALTSRPPSPWTGSRYETRHRWQLDHVRSLDEAAAVLWELADELDAAHAAGWWLTEPVRNGHLLAERASRRRRADQPAAAERPLRFESTGRAEPGDAAPVLPPWRARVVDEPPQAGDAVLHLEQAPATPVVVVSRGGLHQLAGPPMSDPTREGLERQDLRGLEQQRWGVAPARVGPTADLVADGSALRMHAAQDGALVRTLEAFSFLHAADRAQTLPSAAAAYRRLAQAVGAMLAAGGRLAAVDDGLLHVAYRHG